MIEIWSTNRIIAPELYLNDAMPSMSLVIILQILTCVITLIAGINLFRNRQNRMMLLIVGLLIQAFQYFYYCAYVDEIYVNLEHSWNLYHFGRFSFSPMHLVDGTVELFYYIILAPFALSHLSLIYSCMVLGLVVTLLHTIIVWYFVRHFSFLVQYTLVLAFSWNPVFAEIQGSGFGNGMVSLLYLTGFVCIWENRWKPASTVCILLPLLRPDAVIFSAFLILAMILKYKKIPYQAVIGMFTSVGIFTLIVRISYGHWILTPILFKKTPIHEVLGGLKPQLITAVYGLFDSYTMAVVILLLASVIPAIRFYRPEVDPKNQNVIRIQMMLMFCLYFFYILTNRNFFAETRRYYLPFEYLGFFLLISEWGLPYIFKTQVSAAIDSDQFFREQPDISKTFATVFMLVVSFWSLNSASNRWKNRVNRFSDRTSSKVAWLVDREDSFSVQAEITRACIPLSWRIATTELQGYGFLLDHEIDPLYGYANRRMAVSQTLSRRGTKTDKNYLFDSKPDVIWMAKHSPLVLPHQFNPENQAFFFSHLQTDLGFNLGSMLDLYPSLFILQAVSSQGSVVETAFFVIKGLEDEFRKKIQEQKYEMYQQISFDRKSIEKWSDENPF